MNNNYNGYFNGIAGYDVVKRDAFELIDMINNEEKYVKCGARMPKGYLLYGEPGMGKTRFARAVIRAAKCPSFEISEERCVREGVDAETLIVNKFAEAKAAGKSIVFIDEIDKIAGYDKVEYDLQENLKLQNILLQAIDDAERNGAIVVATANLLHRLPGSLIRSGRFDRMTLVSRPNLSDCRLITAHYLEKINRSADFDEESVCRSFLGCSCADIECIVNEAIIHAVARGDGRVSETDVAKAYARVKMKDVAQEEPAGDALVSVAYHEAGHAFVGMYYGKTIMSVSIRKQGESQGRTFKRVEELIINDKEEAEKEIRIALAGKIATETFLNRNDLGCTQDLFSAAAITRELCENGVYGYEYCSFYNMENPRSGTIFGGDEFWKMAQHQKVVNVLNEQDRIVRTLFAKHGSIVNRIAERLLEKGELGASELKEFFDANGRENGSTHKSCNNQTYDITNDDERSFF